MAEALSVPGQSVNWRAFAHRGVHVGWSWFSAFLTSRILACVNSLWGAWGVVPVLGVLCTLDSGVQSMCMRTDFQSLVPAHPECTPYCEVFSSGDGFAMFG